MISLTQLTCYLLLGFVSFAAAQNITAKSNTTVPVTITTTTTITTTALPTTNATTISAASASTTQTPAVTPSPQILVASENSLSSNQSQAALPATITSDGSISTTSTSTTRYPTMKPEEMEQVKKSIQDRIDLNHLENRLVVNRPVATPPMSDYAPDSLEALTADATTQFGLRFINNLPGDPKSENVVLSPLSLQNLLNMILLGSDQNSTTHKEMMEVLGYDKAALLANDRLKPHEGMREVFKSILEATHLSVLTRSGGNHLLNTNPGSLTEQSSADKSEPKQVTDSPATGTEKPAAKASNIEAHLQTSIKKNDQPLSEQLNFTLANLVLTNKDLVNLNPEYEKELKNYYNVNIEQFSRHQTSKSNKSVAPLHERVNGWVKSMTNGQIQKLADQADLDDDNLIMVLLNAAHFKGRWQHTFNTKATHERTFYNQGSESEANRAVKFMRQKGVFGYADFTTNQPDFASSQDGNSDSHQSSSEDTETLLTEDSAHNNNNNNNNKLADGESVKQAPAIELSKEESRHLELTAKLNCSVLMLPFSLNDGAELSMIILLPAKRDGVADLQKALDQPTLNEIYRSLSETTVQVELPKFSFEGSHDAKANLMKMGLKSIFQDDAALKRMYSATKEAGQRAAHVDKVIHKAKIAVDESGAEAAAASMATIVLRTFVTLSPPTPYFLVDHPFLFIIRHNRSNMPLFMGRVSSL